MIVNTLKANSVEQLKDRLVVASDPYTLIFAFASTNIDHIALYELLSLKGYIVVTSSSAGQFINGEPLYQGITCMLLELPEGSFKLKGYDYTDDFFDAGEQLGKYAQTAYKDSDALIFMNASVTADHEAILDGFHQGANNEVSVFGGLASYRDTTDDNFIGIDGKVSKQSVGIVVFDKSKVSLQGLVVGGWEPVGTYKIVTKSAGKKIYELDNRPIKDVYKEYFNLQDDASAFNYLEFPIQMIKTGGGTVMRVVVSIEEDGLCFSGHITEGARVFFCSPPITKTVSDSINAINDFQKTNKLMDCEAILAFSCCARLYSFGFYIQNELRSFNEMWEAKHIGFFGHGEIGRFNKEDCDLHNNSVSVVFIKDLSADNASVRHSKDIHYKEHKLNIADDLDKNKIIESLLEQKHVLSNLLQKTSCDLNAALCELDHYKSDLEQKVEAQLTDIKELNREIINTQKEVIFTMGSIAETRSKETGNHVKRVAEYSHIFALLLGLGEETAELIKQASPMHDIGKVGIPDAILNKPGKLTKDEFEKIKTHSQLGYKMLNHSKRPILQVATIIAREHHEKWDGSGYPRGLAGNDIHLYGRISAIADVFDALGSSRCYKKAWKDEDIWAYFKEQKGKHFDPELIDIFFENLAVFKEARKKYRDL